jgi:hypothetical protein
MNLHYGPRGKLPFDLSHKVAPCRYTLAPDASPDDIRRAKKALVSEFVSSLRLHLGRVAAHKPAIAFKRLPSTTNPAFFWQPNEVLAKYGDEKNGVYEYRFDEPHALYLRLIPTRPRDNPFTFGELMEVVQRRCVQLMTDVWNSGQPFANRYGAVSYESSGTTTTPTALTQLHRNGEIWALTHKHWARHKDESVVAMGKVKRCIEQCLANSIVVARDELEIAPPYDIEVGIVGLRNMRLTRPSVSYATPYSDPIHDDVFTLLRLLNDVHPSAQAALVRDFLRGVYAFAAIDF